MRFMDIVTVVVGLVSAVNLLLAFAIIRRLREHTDLLANVGGDGASTLAPTNKYVSEFVAQTVDGQAITSKLPADTLVGFFTPGCQPCEENLPTWVAAASQRSGGRDSALAVVVGPEGVVDDLIRTLLPVANVVSEGPDGPVGKAFGIFGYPTTCTVGGDGAIMPAKLDSAPAPAMRRGEMAAA
ncbi:thioredoxin domain-containing protein [Catelliglobosispora koreensis]|uniref:hypothetical protein n=1 Tax=Catelliglobosispora koreensis TaxID=129052 RepID=UPI0012FC51A9|nr:hypothetical protein [Catelliglobosispora koreensis]